MKPAAVRGDRIALSKMNSVMSDKKNIWRLIIQTLITILTSIGTTLTTQAACF